MTGTNSSTGDDQVQHDPYCPKLFPTHTTIDVETGDTWTWGPAKYLCRCAELAAVRALQGGESALRAAYARGRLEALTDEGSTSDQGAAAPRPGLDDLAARAELAAAAIKALARLGGRWHATTADLCALLGDIPESSWRAWQHTPPAALSVDQLTRISLLLEVFTHLRALHAGPLADEWVTRPNTNPIFAGRSPLAVMRHGGIPVLLEVRALLAAQRGSLGSGGTASDDPASGHSADAARHELRRVLRDRYEAGLASLEDPDLVDLPAAAASERTDAPDL